MLLTTSIILALILSVHGADKCGDRCTTSQVCVNDGTCINESDLVRCGSWSPYYCHKGYECCDDGCMPEGEVCCYNSFCPSGHTCCGMLCCKAGTFCGENGRCILDKYSTKKPSTTRSTTTRTTRTTFYPTTRARTRYPTTEYRTRYPTTHLTRIYPTTESSTRYTTPWTTNWFNDYTTRHLFHSSSTSTITVRWWYGVIAGAAVVILAIILVVWKRRKSTSNGPGQSGRGGVVLSAPAQTYRNTPGKNMPGMASNTGVTIHTNGQNGRHNAAFVAT